MGKAAMLAGTAGGIIGTIMGIIGVMWSLMIVSFAVDYYNYWQLLLHLRVIVLGLYPSPQTGFLFLVYSLVLASFLIVSCTLLGVGFYGVYKASGGAMGVVGLIFGILGGPIGSLFIMLGHITTISQLFILGVEPIFVSAPNTILIWIGMVILAVTFIVLGSSSIAVHDMTNSPSASTDAGVLSIIGACSLVFYILLINQYYFPLWGILGGGLTLVGFILIFVAFILWARVFYKSRNM